MDESLQQKIREILKDPRNIGEIQDADAVGTMGNSECGEMLRMWIKYRDDQGKKVIDNATFQSFGCETAIAVASMATELLKGKTVEEALSMKTEDLSGELGALPPMKIHCAELVEGAMRAALGGEQSSESSTPSGQAKDNAPTDPGLIESLGASQKPAGERRIKFL